MIPNIIIAAPLNEMELRDMLFTALHTDAPFAIRYPRGECSNIIWRNDMQMMPLGKGVRLGDGSGNEQLAILSLGTIGLNAQKAADILKQDGIDVALYNYRFLKPLDVTLTDEILAKYETIITLEDGVISGGFGSAIAEYAAEKSYHGRIIRLGLPDSFVQHGNIPQLQHLCGIDCDSICKLVRKIINKDIGVPRKTGGKDKLEYPKKLDTKFFTYLLFLLNSSIVFNPKAECLHILL
jgi:1-deoxy-D-xylulose-5-phosphate synthase